MTANRQAQATQFPSSGSNWVATESRDSRVRYNSYLPAALFWQHTLSPEAWFPRAWPQAARAEYHGCLNNRTLFLIVPGPWIQARSSCQAWFLSGLPPWLTGHHLPTVSSLGLFSRWRGGSLVALPHGMRTPSYHEIRIFFTILFKLKNFFKGTVPKCSHLKRLGLHHRHCGVAGGGYTTWYMKSTYWKAHVQLLPLGQHQEC